jgi:UDP-2,4-diacetamido-2,4,6-trideoxy-beta-L-altropyranose hydrolase
MAQFAIQVLSVSTSMYFIFRADSSIDIGTGHIMRCITLANALKAMGHECSFICKQHSGNINSLIIENDFELHELEIAEFQDSVIFRPNMVRPKYYAWIGSSLDHDAKLTNKILEKRAPDWIVVDHYALDVSWHKKVRGNTKNIMVIDDLANRHHDCEILVDQNLGRIESDYDGLLNAGCKRLIGPRYALLRPEFESRRENSLRRRERPRLKRILISLGGIDLFNVTGKLLEALADSALEADTILDILMGGSAPHLGAVREQASQMSFKASVNVDVNDMAERMCLADLSIGAAGATSWERCCSGLPAVIMVLADNQVKVANALEESGAVINIGDPEKIRARLPLIVANVRDPDLLTQMSVAAAKITDGKGALSVINSMRLVSR